MSIHTVPSPSAPDQGNTRPADLRDFRAPPHAAVLGLGLYLAGMSVAFAWLLLGYILLKGRADLPRVPLPAWFWLSTGLILVASLMIHWAWRGGAGGSVPTARHGLSAAAALSVLFAISQVMGFVALLGRSSTPAELTHLYKITFCLALLHGLHLLGGMGFLGVTLGAALRGRPPDAHRLYLMVIYWHFLAVVWMLMFSVFLLAPGGG